MIERIFDYGFVDACDLLSDYLYGTNIQRIFLIHSRMSQTYLITDYLISISAKKNTTICLIGNFSVHAAYSGIFYIILKCLNVFSIASTFSGGVLGTLDFPEPTL